MKKFITSAVMAIALTLAAVPASAGLFGSDKVGDESDTQQAQALESLVAEGFRKVPMPAIINFFERQMARTIYELRDDPNYQTYAYWTTLDGQYVYVCDAIGYGLNASVQFASPTKLVDEIDLGDSWGAMQLPQAEPNALYMPDGLAATYILCAYDPNVGPTDASGLKAVYAEQNMFISPFKIPTAINPYE